eukprot:4029215-Pleurochrysis_carterae.AAC.11
MARIGARRGRTLENSCLTTADRKDCSDLDGAEAEPVPTACGESKAAQLARAELIPRANGQRCNGNISAPCAF